MYTVYKKCPGIDIDMCWEEDIDYFETQEDAEQFAILLTETYKDLEWKGHKNYMSKFYAYPISQREIESKSYQYALWQANNA